MSEGEWRPIAGFVGVYEVSSDGRVRRLAGKGCRATRELKQSDRDGYRIVWLCVDCVRVVRSVHQLVAKAFLPESETPGATEVNHKNFDKSDNRADNLEWITRRDNNLHARNGGRYPVLRGETAGFRKLTNEKVKRALVMRRNGATQKEVADAMNVSQFAISCIENGKTLSHLTGITQ